ncbi:hypothetical protein HZA56_21730 [Candidatus Poribacteria bacterium]|nr:hypothetical protein [Candidatus Poribacteria bacterium]
MNTSKTKRDLSIKELSDLTGMTMPTLRAVSTGSDRRVPLKCLGGCDTENVLGALDLTFKDLMPEAEKKPSEAERQIRSPPAHQRG